MTDLNQTLLRPWTGPLGGAPSWTDYKPEDFLPAFKAGIQASEDEFAEIGSVSTTPNFDNTLVAMEKAGQLLERLTSVFWVHAHNLNVGPIPELQKQVMPLLAAHRDRVMQNQELFGRVAHVYNSEELSELSEAQRRLVKDKYLEFIRYGAKLSTEEKVQLTEINQALAKLYADFSQHVLDDEQTHVTWIEDITDLGGLPENLIEALRSAAKERTASNKEPDHRFAVLNTRSMVDPFLTYADNRTLRKEVWSKFYARGDNGDENDNNAIIRQMIQLRHQRAKLLGYSSHAHWALEESMAETPEAAMDLMMSIWPKAVARVKEEVADMQSIADELGHDVTIEAWDYRYYAEKVRKQKHDLDFNEVKPYLQLEKLVEAMLWCSTELFGVTYEPTDSIPTFHADVRVWVVSDASAEPVGVFYLDPYAREGKLSGAWMTKYRSQQNINGPVLPLISNNSNFIRAPDDKPTLISWDDAQTLFHEFGHALHGLLSRVQYPSQSGTSVARDYVEFPSQIYEHWLTTPEVLNRFCVHHETGQPIPDELVEKIRNAAQFNQGYSTVEFLSSAILDMKMHLEGNEDLDPKAFEQQELAELGMPREMVMRHRLPHFLHLFSGDAYSASYYSYLWADALTADAAEAFEKRGFFDTELAKSLHENVLSKGNTIDPKVGYRTFRGRDVNTDALLRKRGFPI